MAGLTDTLRGDGLVRAQRALAGLEADPLQFDRERQRFSHSPPPYTSNPSTRSTSRNDLTKEQQRRCRTRSVTPGAPSQEQRRAQLWREREAGTPHHQFSDQVEEERRQMWNKDTSTSWRKMTSSDVNIFREEACKTIRKRWGKQGIWNDDWSELANGRWKHEELLELESESESESETDSEVAFDPHFFFFPQQQRQPKSDDKKRRIAEQRATRKREREASRPYHQFVYHISKERERIQEESAHGDDADAADINTRAYENVKNTWIKREIWNKTWSILPGMSWKHEEPLEEEVADSPSPVLASPLVNGSHDAGEAIAIRREPLFRLWPIISQKASSDSLPLSVPKPSSPPDRISPRRSKRVRPSVSDVAKDLSKTASSPLTREVRSKPGRKVAGNVTTRSSAKPQGVSKRQPAKTARGKARKNEQ